MTNTDTSPSPSFIVSVAAGLVVAFLALVLFHVMAWVWWLAEHAAAPLPMPMPHTDFMAWFISGFAGVVALAGFFLIAIAGIVVLGNVGAWAIDVVRSFGRREATTETHLDGSESKTGEGRAAGLDS